MTSTKLDISPQLCLVAIMYRHRMEYISLCHVYNLCILGRGREACGEAMLYSYSYLFPQNNLGYSDPRYD